jgi:hypothetical protein
MKSYQSCLQESLDTGSTVGVCDQINSIYLCEFFWRQALPLAELTLPKIIGAITGENTRGGGEYSNLNAAWDNAKNSVNFFTEFYAINSFDSFKARSQEEIGSEVCNSFISVSYPEGQGILDSLTITNSPPQYSGNFEAIPFTTTTVPPVSQYKVFYHIYAGEDQGAYYKVYLRGGSGSSYYQDTFSGRMVASGYIPVGEYATNTEDFTAPEGYQELCITVNNDEECGFKQVSTSFASDYIRDKSRQSQIETINIKSQDECVSGSANIYGLLNLNAQEGIGNTIDPEIYNQGIVRICATNNPGINSDAYIGSEDQRWIDVGYCGDTNIRCWIDSESIDKALEFQTSVNESLSVLVNKSKEDLENKNGYLNPLQFSEKIQNISNEKDKEKKFKMIDELFDKVYLNSHKAYLYYLRAGIYDEIVRELFSELDIKDEKQIGPNFPTYDTKYKTILDIITAEDFESVVFEYNDARSALRLTSNQPNVYYKYFNQSWYWSLSKDKIGQYDVRTKKTIDWISVSTLNYPYSDGELTDMSKEFIPKLKGKNYLEGINLLMTRTRLNDEGGIVNSIGIADTFISVGNIDSIFYDYLGRFSIVSESQTNYRMYLRYVNENWVYTFTDYTRLDSPSWKIVDVLPLDMELSDNEKGMLNSLVGKDLTEGAAILFGDVSWKEIGTIVNVTREGTWTFETALQKVEELGAGTYYGDIGVKTFVDEAYEDDLLNEEEYTKFIDEGWDVGMLVGIFSEKIDVVWNGTDFEIAGGEEICYAPDKPTTEILALGTASERVLKKVDELVGSYAKIGSAGCFDSVDYVWKEAGVGFSTCYYTDSKGREYILEDGTKITLGVDKNANGNIIHQVSNYKRCIGNNDQENWDSLDKLSEIEPGDILSYVYNSEFGHNVIFIEWVDSTILKAKVFDWNGKVYNFGETNEKGEVCGDNLAFVKMRDGKKYCKTYQINEVLLQDNKHPVYEFWKPVITVSSSGQYAAVKDNVPEVTLKEGETSGDEIPVSGLAEMFGWDSNLIQESTSESSNEQVEESKYTLDSAIEKAGSLKGDYSTSQENQEFMDALLAQGIINRVEFYKYSDKWNVYSQVPQMSDLKSLLLKIKLGIQRESTIDKISRDHFSSVERDIFLNGKVCDDCGNGLTNTCDEEECFVLGIALDQNCVYDFSLFNSGCSEGETIVSINLEEQFILHLVLELIMLLLKAI